MNKIIYETYLLIVTYVMAMDLLNIFVFVYYNPVTFLQLISMNWFIDKLKILFVKNYKIVYKNL